MNRRNLGTVWKVVGLLGAVAIGSWIFAPNVVSSALPILFLAACPLSMFFMMRAMQDGHGAGHTHEASAGGQRADELRARLTRLEAEQDSLAKEIAALESDDAEERAG